MLTDLGKADPSAALVTGQRQKGEWKLIPWTTAEWKGTARSAYSGTTPAPVKLPLEARGWHAVYIGLATTSGGFNIGPNGIKARLSDEPIFRRMACNLDLLPPRRAQVHEQFLAVAELRGQSVEIAPLPGRPAKVCYVKLVPLTANETSAWTASHADQRERTTIATIDGHSWIWPCRATTAEGLAEEFRGFEDSTVGKWWFQVTGADLVSYPS